MANYASNEVRIAFNEGASLEEKLLFLKDFSEKFSYIQMDIEEECDSYIVCFESRWTAPIDIMNEFLKDKRYNLESFMGVSTEWGNLYYEAFELTNKEG